MIWLAAVLSVVLGSTGQLYLKLGGGRLLDLHTLLGLIFYGAAFLLWLKVLAAWPLSRAYPLLALNFILVAALSALFLHEKFSVGSILGTAFCALGVFFIGLYK